jgi:DNA-binding transcriptional LysR family regulator
MFDNQKESKGADLNLKDHLDKLKAFKVIVDSGTMREAAKRLNVSQPSLTKLVHTLEDATGIELLSRGRHGVLPTDAGRQILLYATSILKDLEDLEQKLSNPTEQMAGHLRIGAYASLAEYLWPDFIRTFRKTAPALRLSLHTSEVIGHQQALERGEIDLLIDAEPRLAGDVVSWNLYEDRFNFYMSGSSSGTLAPETIESLSLIYSPNAIDCDNKKISQHLEENGYFFKERLELDSFMAVLAFAKKGLGLAVLPNRLAEASVKAGHLKPVSLKKFSAKGFGLHHFAVTIREHRKDDPRIRFLIRSLRDWFKS